MNIMSKKTLEKWHKCSLNEAISRGENLRLHLLHQNCIAVNVSSIKVFCETPQE